MSIKKTGPGPLRPRPEAKTQSPPVPTAPHKISPELAAEVMASNKAIPGADDEFEFESDRMTGSDDTSLDQLLGGGGRPSQVRSMERLLLTTADKLRERLHDRETTLHDMKDNLLGTPSAESFKRAAGPLQNARRDVARMRRRLLGIHRRLGLSGSLAATMGAVSDLSRLHGPVSLIANAPPKDQALSMLSSLPGMAPSGQINRLEIPADIDRAAFGSLVAKGLPGGALARAAQEIAGAKAPSGHYSTDEKALIAQCNEHDGAGPWRPLDLVTQLATAPGPK